VSTESATGHLLVDADVKQRRLRLLVTVVLVGTVASVAYHYALAFFLQKGYPLSTFLFRPEDHFNDWDNMYIGAKAFLDGDPVMFAYFPFAVLFSIATTVLPMRLGFVLVNALFLLVMVWMLRRWVVDCAEHTLVKVQYAFILIVLSYPVIFALDRSNLERLVFVLFAGFFYFLYVNEIPWLAALFLGAAIAFKLYPATLLVLLVAERRWKPLILAALSAVGLTVVGTGGLAILGHCSFSEAWQMNAGGKLDYYQEIMVTAGGGIQHGHTLWGLLRLPQFLSGAPATGWQMTVYSIAVGLVFVVLAVYAVFWETERWKRVLIAMVPALLLPYVSADYTLIHMYFPLVFFLNVPRSSRWDRIYVILFAILLMPVDYYYLTIYHDGVSISVIIYPLALLALLLLAIIDRATKQMLIDESCRACG